MSEKPDRPTRSEIEQAMINAERDEAERWKAGVLLLILVFAALVFKYQEEILALRLPLEAALHQPLEVTVLQVKTSGYKHFLDMQDATREVGNGLLVASVAYGQRLREAWFHLSKKVATVCEPLKEPLLKFRTTIHNALADLDEPVAQIRKTLLQFEANYLKEPISQLRAQILQSALFTDVLPKGSEWVLDSWLWFSGSALIFSMVFGLVFTRFHKSLTKHMNDMMDSLRADKKLNQNPIAAFFGIICCLPAFAALASLLALIDCAILFCLIFTGLTVPL